jgi:hypothetical protein
MYYLINMTNIEEPEKNLYWFTDEIWNLLIKYKFLTISTGFDATESFMDNTRLIFKINAENLSSYSQRTIFSYIATTQALEAFLERHPEASQNSQNVVVRLVFHLHMISEDYLNDFSRIPPRDVALMLGALLEICDAPIDDNLRKNI